MKRKFETAELDIPLSSATFDSLSKYFHFPLVDTAKKFGVCTTLLKRKCREFGIKRWPHRKIRGLTNAIDEANAQKDVSPETLASLHRRLQALYSQVYYASVPAKEADSTASVDETFEHKRRPSSTCSGREQEGPANIETQRGNFSGEVDSTHSSTSPIAIPHMLGCTLQEHEKEGSRTIETQKGECLQAEIELLSPTTPYARTTMPPSLSSTPLSSTPLSSTTMVSNLVQPLRSLRVKDALQMRRDDEDDAIPTQAKEKSAPRSMECAHGLDERGLVERGLTFASSSSANSKRDVRKRPKLSTHSKAIAIMNRVSDERKEQACVRLMKLAAVCEVMDRCSPPQRPRGAVAQSLWDLSSGSSPVRQYISCNHVHRNMPPPAYEAPQSNRAATKEKLRELLLKRRRHLTTLGTRNSSPATAVREFKAGQINESTNRAEKDNDI